MEGYLHALNLFRSAWEKHDLGQVMRLARIGIPLLPRWVDWLKSQTGGDFHVGRVDFLQDGCVLFGCAGDHGALAIARSVVERTPDLSAWITCVERGEMALRLAEGILRLVGQHPGVVESEIPRILLGAEPEAVGEVCFWMRELGRIERRKQGDTHVLFPVGGAGASPSVPPAPPECAPVP
jgi:hypothetical protein